MKSEHATKRITGKVLEIQRMSTEDGPGIRTTVFLKGCSLSCTWCHNPESIRFKPELQWISVSCIGCKSCISVCPHGALAMTDAGIIIDRTVCTACGDCTQACPSGALEMLGRDWTPEELVRELVKDAAYFRQSGGGVTLSGGEAALQVEFCAEVFTLLKKSGVHCAVDTSGKVSREALERLLPLTDLVLYDIKEINSTKHKEFTGSGNEQILENAKYIADYIKTHLHAPSLWVRTPIIPGATATKENLHGIGAFIAEHLGSAVERWDLCAFNNLCRDKYRRLGIPWDFSDTPLLFREEMEYFADIARASGVPPSIVKWSGSTRIESENVVHDDKREKEMLAIKHRSC